MRAIITRVSQAQVRLQRQLFAEIGEGILALIGVEKGDTQLEAQLMLERIIHYRIFPNQAHRMHFNLKDIKGELLLVPQFTLAANTRKGNKADFAPAAAPEDAEKLFNHLLHLAQTTYDDNKVRGGKFGAMMDVSSINCGPVTFILETK